MSNKVALVTGASRGIGKACAIELAEAGFDVAIIARTAKEGETREHSSTVASSDTSPLVGSLESTADLVREKGVRGLTVQADLLDTASLEACVATVIEQWGRIDVIVHNGRYVGPGHMDRLMDTPIELIRKQIEANAIAPLIINQLAIPHMIKNGGGSIVNITSSAAYSDPAKPAGEGGWSLGYGMSKAAIHRVAGHLQDELGSQGIKFYGVQPSFIATERQAQDMAKFGLEASKGAPPIVPAKVVRWLVTNPNAVKYAGKNVEAQEFCHEMGLMPGWTGPTKEQDMEAGGPKYDPSAFHMQQISRGRKFLEVFGTM